MTRLDRCNTFSTTERKEESHKLRFLKMSSMESIEKDLVTMLGKTGKIKLDALKAEYQKYYGKPLATTGRLAKVLRDFKGIKMKKIDNGNFYLTVNPSIVPNEDFQQKCLSKPDVDATIQR